MTGLTNIYFKLTEIGSMENTYVTQLPDLKFHIELLGEITETYFRLGRIQKELEFICKQNGYLLETVIGDNQDAIFQLKVNKEVL